MQRIFERALVSAALCSLLAGFCTAAFAQVSTRAAIEASNKRFQQAVARGDAPGAAAAYSGTRSCCHPTITPSADVRRSRGSGRARSTPASSR